MRPVVLFFAFLSSLSVLAQTDSQASEIRKACAAGVMTTQECQQQLEKLKTADSTGSAPFKQVTPQTGNGPWTEPHGRYTIAIAPGWRVDDYQGNLKIVKGSSWAIFDTVSKQGSPIDVAQANAKQMSGMVSDSSRRPLRVSFVSPKTGAEQALADANQTVCGQRN